MPKDNQKEELQRMLNSLDPERLSKKDFVDAFEQIVILIKRLEKRNDDTVRQLTETLATVSDKLKDLSFVEVHKEISKKLDSALTEQDSGMNLIRDKVSRLKNGNDGISPKIKDVIAGVLSQISIPKQKEILLDSPKQFKNKVVPIIEELLKGITKEIKSLKNRPISMSGGVGGGHVKVFDLSDQLDGSAKTFSLPAYWRVLTVDLSSFPNALRSTVDFTTNESTMEITFTSEIDAATSLSAGQTCIITYAEA